MSNQLQQNLDAILLDKNTNLKPENLKTGVTCLGVKGTMNSGIDTSDANATADDIVSPKTAYVNGEKIEGTIQLFPVQTEDELRELGIDPTLFDKDICKAIVAGGAEGGTVIGVHIPFISYAFLKGGYMTSMISNAQLAEDINLSADKIVQGNTILGIEGTASTGGIDTSDATATANDIVKNKTAYANNEKITGVISEVKADGSIGGSYSGPRYDDSTNTIYIEYNEDVDIYYFKYDINNDTVLRQGAKINYQMRRSGLKDYFEVSTEKIKSGEQIMGVTGSFDIEYMPNGFGDNDTTYYVEGDSSYIKDQEILVPYYDTDGGINKNFAIVGNYAILNYRQMNDMTVEDTGYILTEVLSDMEIGTDTMLAVKLKIKEILLPEHISNTGTDFE